MILIVFLITIVLSAALLFGIQPMFTRMVLPLLGGSPAVWNTAVVFYQAILLLGYLYAHLVTSRLSLRKQAIVHLLVLLLPLAVLPIRVPLGWTPPTESNPIPWLLTILLVAVGLPFFTLSTSSPLLQRWFTQTGHVSARDPYFLYAAGNAGNLVALLSYPLLIEPLLPLGVQSVAWSVIYGIFVLFGAMCAWLLWRKGDLPATAEPEALVTEAVVPTQLQRVRWVLLAFVPSSLMLSVTTYLSTNIAPMPLLWAIPLSLYLISFILVFASRPPLKHAIMLRAFPLVLIPLVIAMCAQATQPLWLLVGLHLIVFFLAAMVCHGELAQNRPVPRYLTEFYLWLSVGGVLGGMFNAFVAPFAFTNVEEYPIVLVLACLVLLPFGRRDAKPIEWNWRDLVLPLGVGLLTAGLILGVVQTHMLSGPAEYGVVFGIPALICFGFSRRPIRFGLGLAAIFLASGLYVSDQGRVIFAERSFFGIHRVVAEPSGRFHILVHGSTIHGRQDITSPEAERTPLAYYHPTGPIGQVISKLEAQPKGAKLRVAVVGLGGGALACYRHEGQQWTYYEIDPVVARIARDPALFSFIPRCDPQAQIILGDARLTLGNAPDSSYDLIILDAYTSDAVPTHLLTREAIALYQRKLAPGGILAFHISNHFFDLEPVVGALIRDAGMTALKQDDLNPSDADVLAGKNPSQWMIAARQPADLALVQGDTRWHAPTANPTVWTDDFAAPLSALRWGQ